MEGSVFVCYSRNDEAFVLPLATNLKAQGVPVWLDQWDIPSGSDCDLIIDNAIYDCAHFLIILSPNSVESREVRSELRTALDENKHIVPVLHKPCRIPRQLRLIQRIDFTSHSPNDIDALSKISIALGIAGDSLPRSAEITIPKVEMPVHTAGTANENAGEGSSLISDMQTLADQVDITASGKPNVSIQGQKFSSIQDAVNAGNPGDTIILAAGIYQENLRIDKSFTIKGVGAGKTVIDGGQAGSVMVVGWNRDNIEVALVGITIKGGTGTKDRIDPSPTAYFCGGGIFNKGRLTITDCVISGNNADVGGGIFNKGTLNLNRGASVTQNWAHNGGGIYGNRELINLDDGTVSNNEAEQLGGGIYIGYRSSIEIHSGTISDNKAGNNGGGIYSQDGLVHMGGGTISGNNAHSSGGGIFSYGGRNNCLNGGTIHDNIARIGAGAVNGGGSMTLDGTRIHNNAADRDGNGFGGGISNSGNLILISGSIDHNHASKDGGGIFNTGKWEGNSSLVHDNTLGSDHIPDDIAAT